MTGSLNQQRYLAARAAGRSMHGACVEADFPLDEARLLENAIGRGELQLPAGSEARNSAVSEAEIVAGRQGESPAVIAGQNARISADLPPESPETIATPERGRTTLFERMSAAARTANEPAENITENITDTPAAGEAALAEEPIMAINVAADELRLLIERIERLTEEKKGIADDIKDVFAEAKGRGYEPKIMREMVKLRAMEGDARDERDALITTYRQALGMLDGTPLGDFALSRAA